MDSIDTFKQRALLSMQTTVDALTTEVDKAQKYLDRTRQAEGTGVAALQSGTSLALLLPGKS
jgi:peptide deformylase